MSFKEELQEVWAKEKSKLDRINPVEQKEAYRMQADRVVEIEKRLTDLERSETEVEGRAAIADMEDSLKRDQLEQEKKDQARALLDKLQASADPASADMDALAKEVNEDLNAVDNTFGDDDTLLDDKLKEAAKTLQDGQVYGEVVEGENAYFVVRMDSVLDREATDAEKENIVSERQQNAYNDLLNQWKDDADITVNNREWDKVTLTDNEQYTIKQPETEDTTEDSSTDAGDTTEDSTDTQEDTSSDTQAE